ncbi:MULTISPECIES: sensor domain-containing diguanylate cyclase [Aliivibrio]|uniref:sensor domain-containing diguanylate cyclase n=1 Tax=Aliivibrio TaxID=511678 RepID=UPI00080DDC35|nr:MULTISPECIES: sensor domain-containing diguanylate cyclase [Aliivibrio]MBD1570351.1 diguanylate cyclase [Aliivibrio sp. S10_S31]OCH07047.1 diguanylate cyclase [Aliivibrio fischeri]
MRIKNIVAVGSLLLLSIAMTCAIFYVTKSYNKQSRLIENELKFNANYVSSWIQTAFYHSNNVLHELSDSLTEEDFASLPFNEVYDEDYGELFEIHYQTLMNAIHVFAVDKDCVLLNTKTIGGVDLSSREYCQKLKKSNQEINSVITTPFKDILNRNVISQSVTVNDEYGNFAGIVGIITDFSFFSKALRSVNLTNISSISVLSSDFTVLASTVPKFLPIGKKLDFDYIPKKEISGLKYNQELMFESNERYNGAYQGVYVKKVSDLPFIVLVTKAKSHWVTPLYIAISTVFALLLIFAIFLVKNAYYFGKLSSEAEHYSKLALFDDLTGACNRRCFEAKVLGFIQNYHSKNQTFSVALFDIDYFKQINDTYGHEVGDEVLRLFSRACENICESDDHFARLGGDEFVMLLSNKSRDEAEVILNELLCSIRNIEIRINGQLVQLTSSIGVSEMNDDVFDACKLLSRADEALYEAKRLGRNQVFISA